MMDTSRVFVKGLPPSFTEDEFRNHFAKRYTVTDVKLFPARRIGYVGFKTPQDAAAAIKYHNKTFIRMSKISVEVADNSAQRKLAKYPEPVPNILQTADSNILPAQETLKRKRDAVAPSHEDSKLQEYLGLMHPPSKLKHWEVEHVEDTTHYEDHPKTNGVATTDEWPGSTKERTEHVDSTKDEVHTETAPIEAESIQSGRFISPNIQEQGLQAVEDWSEAVNHSVPEQGTKSDMDWMRSRTSRLLGLVDDDEDDNDGEVHASRQPVTDKKSSINHEQILSSNTNFHDMSGQLAISGASDPSFEAIQKSGRLFIRNLPYTVTEADLRDTFLPFGQLDEVHIPLDSRTGELKGFAFVQYTTHEHAATAFEKLDGTVFQGRLLHVIPATAKRESKLDDYTLSKMPLKKQKQIQRKADASSTTFNWNSMYMNADAVLSSVADRLGVAKSEVFDPTSSDAAIKQAQAETHIIQESKAYFEANGIDLGAFSNQERGDTAILVKNFPYGTKPEDLEKLFSEHGEVTKVLMPPSGTIAIVDFKIVTQARAAFHTLAYRKFRDSILFLEKAPKNLFTRTAPTTMVGPSASEAKLSTSELLQRDDLPEVVGTSSLYVRNLNFITTQERFHECFKPLDGLLSARISTKPDPKNPGKTLSMGFGFLEFTSIQKARAAQAAMTGFNLDGHQLVIKASQKAYDGAEARKQTDQARKKQQRKAKIIVKNLPFEVSKKDIRDLFKAYGELRAVRVPKKFDNSRKGFAFAEFTTPREAENAMDALRDTHLLGRRLILEYAAGETEDPEKEIERLQRKIGRQSDSIAVQKLTASERRKFDISAVEEAEG